MLRIASSMSSGVRIKNVHAGVAPGSDRAACCGENVPCELKTDPIVSASAFRHVVDVAGPQVTHLYEARQCVARTPSKLQFEDRGGSDGRCRSTEYSVHG